MQSQADGYEPYEGIEGIFDYTAAAVDYILEVKNEWLLKGFKLHYYERDKRTYDIIVYEDMLGKKMHYVMRFTIFDGRYYPHYDPYYGNN